MAWPARKSVLVPFDFSAACTLALEEALTLVDSPSHVHVIHVLPSLASEAEFIREAFDAKGRESAAEQTLHAAVERIAGDANSLVRTGDAGDEIVAAAQELGCDLIVMPSHGRSGIQRLVLGSVTERVLRRASCPVLVLRSE